MISEIELIDVEGKMGSGSKADRTGGGRGCVHSFSTVYISRINRNLMTDT